MERSFLVLIGFSKGIDVERKIKQLEIMGLKAFEPPTKAEHYRVKGGTRQDMNSDFVRCHFVLSNIDQLKGKIKEWVSLGDIEIIAMMSYSVDTWTPDSIQKILLASGIIGPFTTVLSNPSTLFSNPGILQVLAVISAFIIPGSVMALVTYLQRKKITKAYKVESSDLKKTSYYNYANILVNKQTKKILDK